VNCRCHIAGPGSLLFIVATTCVFLVVAGCAKGSGTITDPTFKAVDSQPSWSPDDSSFAYTHYPQDVAEQAFGPTQIWVRTLTNKGNFLTAGSEAAWSPDGSVIAFVRAADIYVITLATRTERRLTYLESCFSPSWAPNSDKLVYAQYANAPLVPSDSAGIWTIDVSSLHRKQLVPIVGVHPSWSPVGTSVAYVSPIASAAPYNEIAVLSLNTGTTLRLTDNSESDGQPVWSGDGSRIAWTQSTQSSSRIWLMDSTGVRKMPIADGSEPSWSHGPSHSILYTRTSAQGIRALWLMTADGSSQTELPR
jgi:Tol biopolymer transport system component